MSLERAHQYSRVTQISANYVTDRIFYGLSGWNRNNVWVPESSRLVLAPEQAALCMWDDRKWTFNWIYSEPPSVSQSVSPSDRQTKVSWCESFWYEDASSHCCMVMWAEILWGNETQTKPSIQKRCALNAVSTTCLRVSFCTKFKCVNTQVLMELSNKMNTCSVRWSQSSALWGDESVGVTSAACSSETSSCYIMQNMSTKSSCFYLWISYGITERI